MNFIFSEWNEKNKSIVENYSNGNDIVVSLNDNGFLDDGVISPFNYYCKENDSLEKQLLFANYLDIPEFWETVNYYDRADIIDNGVIKGIVYYLDPIQQHNVKCVKWIENNKAYRIDYYDQYGRIYYFDELNSKEEIEVRIYLSNNKTRIIYNPTFGSYTILNNGEIVKMFENKYSFLEYFIKKVFPCDELFITDDKEMMNHLKAEGYKCSFAIRFEKTFDYNLHNNEILIMTYSDQIEHLEELISIMPQFNFNIAATTLMSDKLNDLRRYKNVFLYPGIEQNDQIKLFKKCSFYYDINHYYEVDDSIYEAYKHNLLILGFASTIHNKNYILDECVFDNNDYMLLASKTMELFDNKNLLDDILIKQNKKPLDIANIIIGGNEYDNL